MSILCKCTAVYQGLGNHYNYSACEYFPLPPNPNVKSYYFCGKDLRDGDAPYFVNGIHSTELFAQRAANIMSEHVAQSPNKVSMIVHVAISIRGSCCYQHLWFMLLSALNKIWCCGLCSYRCCHNMLPITL